MALPANNPASIGTGKNYSTVAAWEADLDDANLDANYVGEVYGLTEDNSSIYFSGGNSTASYKAILRAASGEEADGTDAKGAQIDPRLYISESTNQWNMDIETIEFHTGGMISYRADHADNITNILKCVSRDCPGNTINISDCGTAEINIGICLFRNLSTSYDTGIGLDSANPSVKVINCTAYDMDYGCVYEKTGSFAMVKNCVSVCDEVDAGYDDYQGTPSNMSYCADSGDNTATGTGSIHTAARADEWVDYAADNFKIKDTNAHIYHVGVQITGEGWFPATDMAGVAWNNPPSMGCFEYVAAGFIEKLIEAKYDIYLQKDVEAKYDIHAQKIIESLYDIALQKLIEAKNDILLQKTNEVKYDILIQKIIEAKNDILLQQSVESKYDILLQQIVEAKNDILLQKDVEAKYDILAQKLIEAKYDILAFVQKLIEGKYDIQLQTTIESLYDIFTQKTVEAKYDILAQKLIHALYDILTDEEFVQKLLEAGYDIHLQKGIEALYDIIKMASIRKAYKVIGRTKKFKVIGRTKKFKVVGRTKKFKVIK